MNVTPPLTNQKFLDICAVAERTGISARTWRRIISAGKIGVLRIEGSVRIPEAELERFLAERFVPPTKMRRDMTPQSVESIINAALGRRRGRPRADAFFDGG